jgi:hypothetical protein
MTFMPQAGLKTAFLALLGASVACLLAATPGIAASSCGDLTELSLPGMKIAAASDVAAGQFTPAEADGKPIAVSVPAFCRVQVQAVPTPDSGVLHGPGVQTYSPQPRSGSGDADRDRASQLQHAVERVDSDLHLGRPALVLVRAQAVPDHLFPARDGRLGASGRVVARSRLPPSAAIPRAARAEPSAAPPIRPCSATHWRWRSRCVGALSAVSLGTAVARGGTTTAASG